MVARTRYLFGVTWPTAASLAASWSSESGVAAGKAELHGVAAAEDGRMAAALAGQPGKFARPQQGQSAARAESSLICRAVLSHRSSTVQVRLMASTWPLRILIASLASIEATTPMIVAEDAGAVAGWRCARRRRLGHQAAQAGRLAGNDRQRLAFRRQAAAIDPGNAELDGGIVEQESRFKIVGAIDEAIDAVEQPLDVGVIDVGDDGVDFDLELIFTRRFWAAIALGRPAATSSSS